MQNKLAANKSVILKLSVTIPTLRDQVWVYIASPSPMLSFPP